MAQRSETLKRYAGLVVAMASLLLLSGCALLLNNVREVGTREQYTVSTRKAVLLYGGELQQPWPISPVLRSTMLNFEEYDPVASRNKGNCWRFNHTESFIDTTKVGPPKFSAFVVDPGYFVLNRMSAPGPSVADSAAFYAAPGTVSYVGVYVYNGEANGFVLRRDLAEGKLAAKQFPGLNGPVALASTTPVGTNSAFLCAP